LVALLCWAEDMHSNHVDKYIYIYYIYITKRLSQRKFQDNHGHGSVYYQDYVIFCRYVGLWTKYSTARMTCWPIEDWNQPAIWLWINTY
jgi:hypothetical protein